MRLLLIVLGSVRMILTHLSIPEGIVHGCHSWSLFINSHHFGRISYRLCLSSGWLLKYSSYRRQGSQCFGEWGNDHHRWLQLGNQWLKSWPIGFGGVWIVWWLIHEWEHMLNQDWKRNVKLFQRLSFWMFMFCRWHTLDQRGHRIHVHWVRIVSNEGRYQLSLIVCRGEWLVLIVLVSLLDWVLLDWHRRYLDYEHRWVYQGNDQLLIYLNLVWEREYPYQSQWLLDSIDWLDPKDVPYWMIDQLDGWINVSPRSWLNCLLNQISTKEGGHVPWWIQHCLNVLIESKLLVLFNSPRS